MLAKVNDLGAYCTRKQGYYEGLVFSITVNGAAAHVASHSEIVKGVDQVALALCAVAAAADKRAK